MLLPHATYVYTFMFGCIFWCSYYSQDSYYINIYSHVHMYVYCLLKPFQKIKMPSVPFLYKKLTLGIN